MSEHDLESDECVARDPRDVAPSRASEVALGPAGVVVDDDRLPDGSVPSLGEAAYRLPRRIDGSPYDSPRFGTTWARRTRARLLHADETAREWAETTVLLTMTVTPRLPGTDALAPATSVFGSLTRTRSDRQRRLRRELDGVRWSWIRIVAPHRSGFPHSHQLLYVDDDDRDLVRQAAREGVDAHVDESELARPDDHGAGAVSVSADTENGRGVRYLSGQTPGVAGLIRSNDDEISGQGDTLRGDGVELEADRRLAAIAEASGTNVVDVSSELA